MNDIEKDIVCFFCDKHCVHGKTLWDKNAITIWIQKHGDFRKLKGYIGNKPICEKCVTNMWDIVHVDDYIDND